MKTIVLSHKSKRGRQRLQQHGTKWKIVNREPFRILVESCGKTWRNSNGTMEPDWRWVQLYHDPDFHIELGRSQCLLPRVIREVVKYHNRVKVTIRVEGHPMVTRDGDNWLLDQKEV